MSEIAPQIVVIAGPNGAGKTTLAPFLLRDKLQFAVNHALLMHKRLGNPIATWKDGKVVIVPPEEIVIPTDVTEPNE